MKKTLICILSLALSLLLLAGCSTAPASDPEESAVVMNVGGTEITAKEYNYTYYSNVQEFYSNYSTYLSYFGLDVSLPLKSQTCNLTEEEMTWADFFMDQTEDLLTQVYSFYNAAKAENMELKESYQLQLDAFILSLTEAAAEAEQTPDEYLSANFGSGLTEADYREFLTRRLLATQYCDEKLGAIVYTDAEYEAYYQENKDTLDKLTFRIYTLTEDYLPADTSADTEETTEAAVKAYAELFAKDLTTQEQFCERAIAFAPEKEKANYEDPSSTLAANISGSQLGDGDMKTWLFDSARKEGDVGVYKTSTATYTVCYFISRQRDEDPLVSMRHLLLSVSDTEEGKSDAEVASRIQKLYDDWKAGGASEDAFSALASEHTEDPGSAETGGLYESFSRGTMVTEIDTWLFAEGRKVGDSEIIKTSFGYHIVLFTGYGDVAWKSECLPGLQDADYYELLEELKPGNTVDFSENHREGLGNDY